MFTAFSTALSGLNAMTTAIDVVGNNLANLNTTGYKDETVSFRNLIAESLSGNEATQIGLGTAQPDTKAQFIQGAIETTNGSFDGAVNGQGFFIVKNSDDQDLYTRAGNFQVDKNGYLVSQTGERVQGWTASAAGRANPGGTVNPSGALSDIQVPLGEALRAQASTQFSATVNLNSGTAPSGTWSTGAINLVDSLGNTLPLNVTFTKDPASANTWQYSVAGSGVTVTGGSGTLQFDSSGNLVSPAASAGSIPLAISGLSDGAANMTVSWNLHSPNGTPNLTQYSEPSTVTAVSPDGQPAAVLTGVSLQRDGQIMATYSNGAQQQVIAQLALASIRNPQSLLNVGNNNFAPDGSSAVPIIGVSGTGGLGTIDGGALEKSSVDVATEFARLLTYQRSYQADSRVVTVSDELAQDAVNLVK